MADGEEVTLDGRPLQALRVADLKAALEERGLAKSGQKSALIKRLRGALMLENLQKHSTPHTTFQPNSQIGEEMSQNSFIKQYLEKQQELLRQRLEREAREAADPESRSCVVPREREESDEEEPRRPEQHPSRARQARTAKATAGGHAPGSEERETSVRSRRGAQRAVVKDEEEEEEEEEDDEEDEDEEEDEEEEAAPLLTAQAPKGQDKPGGPPPQGGDICRAPSPIALEAQQKASPAQTPDTQQKATARTLDARRSEAAVPLLLPFKGEAGPPVAEGGAELQTAITQVPAEESGGPSTAGPPEGELAGALESATTARPAEALKEGTDAAAVCQEEPREPSLHEARGQPVAASAGEPAVAPLPPPQVVGMGEPARDEEQEEAAEALRTLEEAEAAAAALIQASPSPPQLTEAQHTQQDHGGDEPPPPLLTKETPAEPSPVEDEAPPQLSRPSPPSQEPLSAGSPSVPEERSGRSPSPLPPLPPQQQRERPRGTSSSRSSSSSASSSSRSRSRGSSQPRSRARRPRSDSSESPPRKRRHSGVPSRSGSEQHTSSCSRSPSRSRSRSCDSSDSSRKSHSPEASRDSTSYPRTKESSPPRETPPCRSPQAQQEVSSSPRGEGRATSPPPLEPERHSTPTQLQPHERESENTVPERGSPEPPFPVEATGPESRVPDAEPLCPSEQQPGRAEEKQEVPMEPSEPRPESEAPEAGPDEHPSTEPPGPDAGPEDEEKKEGSAQPKAFKRKISVVSSSVAKGAAATNSDTEGSQLGGRKRRWGSSTAATQKKPSISITTESLKSLIPEIKPPVGGQEAVVDLHADDSRISEDEAERHPEEPAHEKALKICRTVTQVVPAEGQENGQGEEEEEEEKAHEEEQPEAPPAVAMETVTLPPPPVEHEVKKVTLTDTLTRRSISQQRSSVSITIDDPVRTAQAPSPPRGKVSSIVHICNLVRPFTLGQLKELLGRTGTLVEEAFWIDKIKSHCYVTYSTVEEAVATRNALHGVKWPQSNPKFLSADFAEQDELDFHRGLLAERPVEAKADEALALPGVGPAARGEREMSRRSEAREREAAVREQWAEREREMERRERTRAEREWDRDKVREGPRSRSRSRERRRKERPKSKEKKAEKKEKAQEEPPAKLLDDLFRKTKAAPCIYWLPLTDTQYVQKQAERAARARERERRRKEQEAEEARQRERSRQAEREKRREHSRERERPNATGGGASRGGERSSGRDRDRRDAKARHSRSRSRSTPAQDRGGRR
ncbi:apoptotic chromatin condensation inducer in the nucleus [Varanus komodoensis]|uniref:Apoptotic chromatin condensation inducer 1 n=1 Tax=Varanus komodoensis TaxID=61221 RepID=A0A8D2LH76_VARKO|nr:apoptotic chromatin condensation inducer in the nucleus [Varanus komodoensis]